MVELLRDSVWQRDTLERHVSTLSQELREKNDLLGEAELSRVSFVLWLLILPQMCLGLIFIQFLRLQVLLIRTYHIHASILNESLPMKY